MLGVEFDGVDVKDVLQACLTQHVLCLSAKQNLRLLPPLTISYEEIDSGLQVLDTILKGMK